MLKKPNKIITALQNCIELYIPAVCFAVIFILFCYQILVRYVISKFTGLVVPWTTELEQMCFLWLALLGACYVQRNKGHVTFTLLYDVLPTKGKMLMNIISSSLVSFACAITLIPSMKYVLGLMRKAQVTPMLRIPKTVVYFPYIIFLCLILIYGIREIYEAIMAFFGNSYYMEKLLRETMSEAEQAVEQINSQKEEILQAAAAHEKEV